MHQSLTNSTNVLLSSLGRRIGISINYRIFAARIVTRSRKFDHITPGLREVKWLSVASMLVYRDGVLAFKCLRGLASDYLAKKFKRSSDFHSRDTRNKNKIDIPGDRTAGWPKVLSLSCRFTVELFALEAYQTLTKMTNIAAFKKKLTRYLKSSQ